MSKCEHEVIESEKAFGDCSYCGHSIIYHGPMVGCLKCHCSEYE